MLDFHGPRRKRGETVKVVWRAELPKALSDRSCRVQYLKEFGWVLVVRFTHEDAEAILAGWLWVGYVEGQEAPFPMLPTYFCLTPADVLSSRTHL